jgi:hypothetical protein
MLGALTLVHSNHITDVNLEPAADTPRKVQNVMHQHSADDPDDEPEINLAYPPIDQLAKIASLRRRGRGNMHFALGEVFARARMTPATGLREMTFMDGGLRIGGGKDPVITMATGAIGCEGTAVSSRQAVVTFKKCFYAVGRQIEPGINAL